MYRRLLVAVDGSGASTQALTAAAKLAKETRAKLRLVTVADVLPPPALNAPEYIDPQEYRSSMLAAGRAILERAVRRATALGVRPDAVVLETVTRDVSAAIVEETRRWRADLVVLGTHGRTGLARLLLGSVAEGVARHAPVAVLLVRERKPRGAAPRRPRRDT